METVINKSRTANLTEIAFSNGHHKNNMVELEYLISKGYLETCGEHFHNFRRAKMDCIIFDNYTIEVTPGELLAGRFSQVVVLTEEQEEILRKGKEAMKYGGDISGHLTATQGHHVLDFAKLLNGGVKSILARIDEKLAGIDFGKPDDAEKAVFYRSMKISLEGFCRFARRFHDKLLDLATAETEPKQKAEYTAMANNFVKAPYEPCTTFYEALQMVWFTEFSSRLLQDCVYVGRPDNYLRPFYCQDIESGVLTKENAYELITNLYCKVNEIFFVDVGIFDGTKWSTVNWIMPNALMIGGVDRKGLPVWNDLSRMFIDAIETVGLANPSVSVAYTDDMPEDLLTRCVEVISKGYTMPAIFNDRIIRRGLEEAGVAPDDATQYNHSSCVEINPIASSYIQVATPFINLVKALEYVLGNGKPLYGGSTEPDIPHEKWAGVRSPSPVYGGNCGLEEDVLINKDTLKDFNGFYNTVKDVIEQILRRYMVDCCYQTLYEKRYNAGPLSSSLTNDCVERGMDLGAGGAKYNFVYPCFPGFTTLVDSLAAIKTAVYDERKLTLEELTRLCKDDFKDEEKMRFYLMNRCPKFGNDDDKADVIAKDLYDFIRSELAKYRFCLGNNATFHPSFFSYVVHGRMGKLTAATPNGRHQGEALSECMSASQGMDRNTPLGVVRSISKLDQHYGIGGINTNMRFSKDFLTALDGRKSLEDFIRYFMKSDCFQLQFNVVDGAVLKDAQKNPEKYDTLMVRVSGYSDYFRNLPREIQDEIISRTEHGVV
jgi:formate C-acetyltransferase